MTYALEFAQGLESATYSVSHNQLALMYLRFTLGLVLYYHYHLIFKTTTSTICFASY